MPDSHVKVALVGLSKRSIQALLAVFKQRCQGRFVLAMPAAAQIAVFNMDCANARQTWRTFKHKHPALPVVVIARNPPHLENVQYVAVPISVPALEQALDRAAAEAKAAQRNRKSTAVTRPTKVSRTGARPVAAAPLRCRPGAARELPAIQHDVYFQPGDYLFSRLRRALDDNRGTPFLFRVGDALIAVDEVQERLYTNLGHGSVQDCAANALPESAGEALSVMDRLDPNAPLPDTMHVHEYAVEPFLWDLAVAAAGGRVPEGTPLDAPVYLRRWPNFTRLVPFADAMLVSSIWVQQPRSLLNIYHTLKTPVANVFTLYTAAQAVGLAGIARRESDALIEPAVVEPSAHGNLINAVLNRFMRSERTGTDT